MRTKILGLMAVGLLGAQPDAMAMPVLDQSNQAITGYNFNTQATSLTWQQGVTAGLAGLLTSVDIYVVAEPGSFFFEINRGGPWQSDAVSFSRLVSPLANVGWYSIDVSAAGILLSIGEQFALQIRGNGPSDTCCGIGGDVSNNYSGGAVWLNGTELLEGKADLNFRTYVDSSSVVVPEPGTLALLGLSLAGLGLSRRRRAN